MKSNLKTIIQTYLNEKDPFKRKQMKAVIEQTIRKMERGKGA